MWYKFSINSWPSDAIWRHRSGITLAQVMACCLMAPNHYLNQCWLLISEVFWHLFENHFTATAHATILYVSKINEKVGAAAVIKRLFQDGKTTRNLSKRLPDGSSIFSAEATAIILALDYYNAMPAVRHDVVIYSDSLSCLQAIQGEDTEHPLMCRIMNLLWKLSDKGTHVKFCWIPSHCGIEGNEAADKLAKESLGLNIDALLGIFHADLKPQVNAYVQQLMQVKWDVEVHGRDLYLLKANLAPPDRYKHLKRAEEVAMTRLRIGHCKATKGHIVSRGPPAVCHHCGSTLSREHILLECGTVQELRGEFYEADSLTSLFECVRPLAIIEYLKEAGFFYLIWQVYECEIRNVKSHKPQNPDYHIIEEDKWIAENIRKMCRTANMSWRTCVVVKQTQSHPHEFENQILVKFLPYFPGANELS